MSISDKTQLTQFIKERAQSLGFAQCGIAPAERLTNEEPKVLEWLEKGYNGTMAYMANHFDKRMDPTLLVEGAQSVIVVLFYYYPPVKQRDDSLYKVSKYAYGEDYHEVLKTKLHALGDSLSQHIPDATFRAFVDSAPVMERSWAVKAGLGWTGKHSLLIVPRKGSYFFIGELVTNVVLDYDKPFIGNLCGACMQCMISCPTGAIVAPGVVDARKCISYQTIELKDDEVPVEFQGQNKEWVYGCDVCQDACPWNRKAEGHDHADFQPNDSLLELSNNEWDALDEDRYKILFKGSAIKRAKYKGLKRNISFLKQGRSK